MSRLCVRLVAAAALLFAACAANGANADFSGTWERYPDPYSDERFPDDPPPPAGGPKLKEPYGTAYRDLNRRKAEADKKGKPLADPATRCLPEGMPTIMAAVGPIEILQTPRQIVILAEFLTQTRRIYVNEKMPASEDISPGYNGYSVARWQGDTLVVQTVGVREDVKFMGIPHSAHMKVTERLRLTGPGLLENQITLDDPEILAKPYNFTFGYKRNPEYRVLEYICDNNRNRFDADGNVSLEVAPK
ncbi:MAG: hypothetical protein ABI885_14790 [Gammaproteobacteria bacterium]